MVLDLNLPKEPLAWFTVDEYEARDRSSPTWLSVPHGMTLEMACEDLDLRPKDWELAKGSYLTGFTEYRRKEDEV